MTFLTRLDQLTAAILLTMVIPASAFAGGTASGGGKGVVCRNPDGSVQSAQLLDLWEFATLHPEQVTAQHGTFDEQFARAEQNVLTAFTSEDELQLGGGHTNALDRFNVQQALETARDFISGGPTQSVTRVHGAALELTEDSFEEVHPTGNCAIEQIVRYRPIEQPIGVIRIIINQDLYDKMNVANQVALLMHEGLYTALRTMGNEPNSIRVRRAVSAAINLGTFSSRESFLTASHVACASAGPINTVLYLAANERGVVNVLLTRIDGRPILGPLPQDIEWHDMIHFANGRPDSITGTASLADLQRWLTHPVSFDAWPSRAFVDTDMMFSIEVDSHTHGLRFKTHYLDHVVDEPIHCEWINAIHWLDH